MTAMFNKLLFRLLRLFTVFPLILTFAVTSGNVGNVIAAVNVNKANEAMLMDLTGIGPVKAKAIISERDKNGPYRNAADLASRVKGFSAGSVEKLQKEGLTVDQTTAATPPAGKKVPSPIKK